MRCARESHVPMTEIAADPSPVLPFHDPSRRRRLVKVGAWLAGTALVIFVLNLLGVDVRGGCRTSGIRSRRFRSGTSSPVSSSRRARRSLQGSPTTASSAPRTPARSLFWPIVTAYAVGVSMNNFLPANIGTFVTLLMFVAIIPSATVGGSFAAYLVQKIFFTIVGTFVYLYLFLSVPGSFHENLGNVSDHPAMTILIVAGGGFLIVLVGTHLLAAGQEAVGTGKARRSDPQDTEAIPDQSVPTITRVVDLQAGGHRHLPGRLRDSGDLRVDHVDHRLGLARKRRLLHTRRRRHHPGDERAGPADVL